METTFIYTPEPGSGHGKKYRAGREAVETLLQCKQSVVTVNNTDELFCARAIVTKKAWVEGNGSPTYRNSYQGCLVQTRMTPDFQDALLGYQIKVLSVDRPHCIIFCGETPSHKRIFLIKVGPHYHGYTSSGGFLSKSYFCYDCNRGFDHDDVNNHGCEGKRCRPCERLDYPDFIAAKQQHLPLGQSKPMPRLHCPRCNRYFYGENCLVHHRLETVKKRSIWNTVKRCPQCSKMNVANDKKVNPKGGNTGRKY